MNAKNFLLQILLIGFCFCRLCAQDNRSQPEIKKRPDTIWTQKMNDTLWLDKNYKTKWKFEEAVIIGGVVGDRLIKWSDFKSIKKTDSPFDAEVYWYVKNDFDVLWLKKDTVGIAFRPQLFFDESISWTLPSKQTEELLSHEELHFVIGRLCLLKLYITSQNTVFLKNNMQEKISTMTSEIIADFIQMNRDYDTATNHSKIKTEQKKWNDLVWAKLAEYKARL